MSHQEYVRPSGQWLSAFVITPNDLRRFDLAQYQSVNGSLGGTWNPLSALTFGGSGLQLIGTGHQLSGGLSTASGGRVVLGHSDYPTFASAGSRSILIPLLGGYLSTVFEGLPDPLSSLSTGTGAVFNYAGVATLIFPLHGRDLHRGAALSTAVLTFRIGQQHLLVPGQMPNALLLRSDWCFTYYEAFAWAGGVAHAVGDLVTPSPPNGYVYAATTAATSGATQPIWPTTPGGTVNDNGASGVTWVCTGTGTAPQWGATTAYASGKIVQPSVQNASAVNPPSPNGMVYECTTPGTTGASAPAWPTVFGQTVVDGTAVWTCLGVPGPFLWQAATTYLPGQLVTPARGGPNPAGLIFQCQAHGASAAVQPSWKTTVGSQTTDNATTWLCAGSMTIGSAMMIVPNGSGATYFNAGAPQELTLACTGGGPNVIQTDLYSYELVLNDEGGLGAFSAASAPWYALAALPLTDAIQPNPPNGYYYELTSKTTGITGATQPVWPLIVGHTVVDAGVTWTCAGQVGVSMNVFTSAQLNFTGIVDMRPE